MSVSHSGPALKYSNFITQYKLTLSAEFPTEITAARSSFEVNILAHGSMGIDLHLAPLVDI